MDKEKELEKVDTMLHDLIELANSQVESAKQRKFFSKDLAEACGILISLAYGRWGK